MGHALHRFATAILWALMLASPARAADVPDYAKDIKPLLARCYSCHGALKQQADLRLDTIGLMRKGGESGSVLAAKAADSLLIHALTGAEGRTQMPPEGEGSHFTAEEIGVLSRWIDAGAVAPEETPLPDPRQHWSF